MSRKENLKELQSRLAQRLAQANEAGSAATWLAVRLGQMNALFALTQAGEIFKPVALTPLPYVAWWFAGVANLRGTLYGVLDLAGFLQQVPERSLALDASAEARLLTFNAELEINCALWVDALLGLRREDAFVSRQAAAQGAPAYWGERLTDANGEIWQEINLRQLSQSAAFLAISG
jgi:twitching motility protein PilI